MKFKFWSLILITSTRQLKPNFYQNLNTNNFKSKVLNLRINLNFINDWARNFKIAEGPKRSQQQRSAGSLAKDYNWISLINVSLYLLLPLDQSVWACKQTRRLSFPTLLRIRIYSGFYGAVWNHLVHVYCLWLKILRTNCQGPGQCWAKAEVHWQS